MPGRGDLGTCFLSSLVTGAATNGSKTSMQPPGLIKMRSCIIRTNRKGTKQPILALIFCEVRINQSATAMPEECNAGHHHPRASLGPFTLTFEV